MIVAVFRLPQFGTDVVISVNHPVSVPDESSTDLISLPSFQQTNSEFMTLLRTFRILDLTLFVADDEDDYVGQD